MEAPAILHPAADVLNAFALGKLGEATAARVLSHLNVCPACRAHLPSQLPPTLSQVQPPRTPALMARPAEEKGSRRWLFGVGVAALLLAVLVGMWAGGVFRGKTKEGITVRPALLDCTGKDGVSAAEMREAQAAWAKYLGRKVEETVEIADGVTMTFVLVPPGKFKMGSPEGEDKRYKDETLHEITLTEPFYLGKYEVTQVQYEALTGKNRSAFKGTDLPVEQVDWDEARDFTEKLTKKRRDKQLYRLPSEAEWEYSCRGGRSSSQPFGIGFDDLSLTSRQANFDGKSTCKVGSYSANALGLYDMHGNVWEWCADYYGPYPVGHVTNPTGPSEGSARVFRGGSWFIYGAWSCRAAYRFRRVPGDRDLDLGFRLARSSPSGVK